MTLQYITLADIKAHCRIDADTEDSVLTLYGCAAEQVVLAMCNTTYAKMLAAYSNEMPAPVVQATLMLVDHSYQQRSPVSMQNMAAVPYTFDFMLKPYMILADEEEDDE